MPFRLHTRHDAARIAAVQAHVALHFGVSVDDLTGPDRHAQITWPRHVAIYLCAHELELPHDVVAPAFNRDPKSIGYAVAACQRRVATEPKHCVQVDQLATEVRAMLQVMVPPYS